MNAQRALAGLALALFALDGRADGFVNVYEIPSSVSMNVIGNQLTHEILNRTLHHWDKHEAQQKAERAKAKPIAPASGGSVAGLLTKDLPGRDARGAEATYRQALHYHEIVIKKFGLASGDLGVAIASSIAGAWMAYNNKSFPDQYYLPLVRQMQQRVGESADLRALPAADRATAYEALAIVGMMLASSQITLERNPQAAGASALRQNMRSQGGEMLTRMLNVPPEQVGISASGFVSTAGAQR